MPEEYQPTMSIYTQDQLIFQQTTSIMANDFLIHDRDGGRLARVKTDGNAFSRALFGARALTMYDMNDTVRLRVRDIASVGRDRLEVFDAAGNRLAEVVKQLTVMKTRVAVEMSSGSLELQGDIVGLSFRITDAQRVWAAVSREWSGPANAFLGKSTYSLDFLSELDEAQRNIIIGSVLALDLLRKKQSS